MSKRFVVFLGVFLLLAVACRALGEQRARPHSEDYFLKNAPLIFVGRVLEVKKFGKWTMPTKVRATFSLKGRVMIGVRDVLPKDPGKFALFKEEFDQARVGAVGVFFVGTKRAPSLLMKYKEIPGPGSPEPERPAAPAKPVRARPEPRGQPSRFRRAYNLIMEKRYAEALVLLRENIKESPKAGDIDYSYAWAAYCLARLGHYAQVLEYYEIIQTRFYGWQTTGARGARRNWAPKLDEIKKIVASSRDPLAAKIPARMRELDSQAAGRFRAEALALVRAAAGGGKAAQARLRSLRYRDFLVDLIASGELRLVEKGSKAKK